MTIDRPWLSKMKHIFMMPIYFAACCCMGMEWHLNDFDPAWCHTFIHTGTALAIFLGAWNLASVYWLGESVKIYRRRIKLMEAGMHYEEVERQIPAPEKPWWV